MTLSRSMPWTRPLASTTAPFADDGPIAQVPTTCGVVRCALTPGQFRGKMSFAQNPIADGGHDGKRGDEERRFAGRSP